MHGMARRAVRDIDSHLLQVLVGADGAAPTHVDEGQDLPEYEDPDTFGVRVAWQSEEEKLEAAEFLVATRVQQDARIRARHEAEMLRHQHSDPADRTDEQRARQDSNLRPTD